MDDNNQQPEPQKPAKNRSGGPKGNLNRWRHGLRGTNIPYPGIKRQVDMFRRAIEAEVMARHGQVSLVHAAIINTCYRLERHAQLAQRWLKVEGEKLTPMERLHYSNAIAQASMQRDKALNSLGLDTKQALIDWKNLTAAQDDGGKE